MKDINLWLEKKDLDIDLRYQLEHSPEEELMDAFYKDLEFGTGGLRGILGVGTNRINIYTIRKNTEGYARYIESFGEITKKQMGIVIAYDNRHNSQKFAFEAARVLANHGIKSYVFESLRPTPELSFAIRFLQAFGGIVITASHNPKEYSGYKIYDSDGCQCIPKDTDNIIKFINGVKDYLNITIANDETLNKYLNIVGETIDLAYLEAIKKIQIHPELSKNNLKIVFTPQHGTSNIPVRKLFNELNYNLIPVISQCSPDPEFSNTNNPNPEHISAFYKSIEIAEEHNADLIISTDPDCDRLGIMVKHDGKYMPLTGNQTGAILLDYILTERKKLNNLPKNGVVFNTIVTNDLGISICKKFGIEVESTLTGFKFIGDRIRKYQKTKEKEFIFGYEESYGYLMSDICLDKDGVQSCLLIAEVVNFYKQKNLDLIDVLENIYNKYGFIEDAQESLTLKGEEGNKKIKNMVKKFRNEQIKAIGNQIVIAKEDYLLSIRTEKNNHYELNLPKSNVIKYIMDDGSWFALRPSGTESKIKFYFSIRGKNKLKIYKDFIHNILEKE